MKLRTNPEAIRPVKDAGAPVQKPGIIEVDRAGNATVRTGKPAETPSTAPRREAS